MERQACWLLLEDHTERIERKDQQNVGSSCYYNYKLLQKRNLENELEINFQFMVLILWC